MIDLLRRVAADHPSRTAVVTDEAVVTYCELVDRAHAVAAALRQRHIERFAIVDADAAHTVALLAGAALAGVEATQYPATVSAAELQMLADRFDHRIIVGERSGTAADAERYGLDDLLAGVAAPAAGPAPSVQPLLVLTTGTTGLPRGVRHDWPRLLRGTAHVRPTPSARWLLCYGLHQFAGLQILLHVFAAGATLVAPTPRRPRDGLLAMRRHAVDCASATPTYWRFLLAELRADNGPVPELSQITLGGEAVPGPLLDDLHAMFPAAAITQVYAASEFGSTGSVRDRRSGLSTEVLNRDQDADISMRIIDGELWIRSHTGMLGYYGEEPVDPDGWRPTGDLVEVIGDRIHFRGRASEVINVGGVKVHPLPIEERLASVEGISMARVFGRPNAMTGAIVAVEAIIVPTRDPAAVKAAIRDACADLPAAAQPRSIQFVDSIAMTQHKIVRAQRR